jgi:hypothetical protein
MFQPCQLARGRKTTVTIIVLVVAMLTDFRIGPKAPLVCATHVRYCSDSFQIGARTESARTDCFIGNKAASGTAEGRLSGSLIVAAINQSVSMACM